jgi:hypothetical protein
MRAGLPEMLVYSDSGISLEHNVAEVPSEAGKNREQLLSIGEGWYKLAAPARPAKAWNSNVASLLSTLSSVGRDSLFRRVNASQEVGYTLDIDKRSPVATYEFQILLNLAAEQAASRKPIGVDDHVSNLSGGINVTCLAEKDGHRTIDLGVYPGPACKEFYAELERRDQALVAGRIFASKLSEVANEFERYLKNRDPVELGSCVFRGEDGPAAVAAFLARNIQNVIRKSPTQEEVDLRSVVELIPIRQVTELTSENGYDIDADFVSYRLQMTSNREIKLSALLHPEQMFRDTNTWFSSSTAAQELTSILLASGVAHALPNLAMHAVEVNTDLQSGNGYASLSRIICTMISDSRHEDLEKLCGLNNLFDESLGDELCRFRKMSSSIATHLVLDLLSDLLGNNYIDPSLATFSARSRRGVPTFNSCNHAERYFVSSLKSGAYSLDQYFLYKQEGEDTALARVPIVVDNVLIPKGTLCFVSKRDGVIELVKPIRLTLFNLPLDGEGAEVFRYHLGKIYSAGLTDTDVRAVYRILEDDSCGSPRGI